MSYTRAPASLLKRSGVAVDALDVATDDDQRLEFAATLGSGDELALVRADGPPVDALLESAAGVDLTLSAAVGTALEPGALLSMRVHRDDGAWFVTLVVLGVSRAGGELAISARIGDAARVSSERWTERLPLCCAALVRCDGLDEQIERGETTDISPTGVAVRLAHGAVATGLLAGVVIAGDGRGSVAFRGRIAHVLRAGSHEIVGIEVVGISGDDRRRLAQLVARSRRT